MHYVEILGYWGAHVTIGARYCMSPAIIGKIIPETCNSIWNILLLNGHITVPKSEEDWCEIAKGVFNRWNSPKLARAIDGKHVLSKAPAHSGSMLFKVRVWSKSENSFVFKIAV